MSLYKPNPTGILWHKDSINETNGSNNDQSLGKFLRQHQQLKANTFKETLIRCWEIRTLNLRAILLHIYMTYTWIPVVFTSISCSCSWFVAYICCKDSSNSVLRSSSVFPSSAARWRSKQRSHLHIRYRPDSMTCFSSILTKNWLELLFF